MVIAVRADDPRSAAAAGLVRRHFAISHAITPAAFAFVLDEGELCGPDVRFFTAWDGDALAGMGAIKHLGGGHAELKSMRTDSAHLRKGVAAAILRHMIDAARADGAERLSLETGTGDEFVPARALYRRFGFVDCPAFADNPADSPHNQYMTLALKEA